MLLQLDTLPSSYSKGAQKAWGAMISDYPRDEGKRIFVQRALEFGKGGTLKEIVDSVYATGKHPSRRQRRQATILLGRHDLPIVRILGGRR